MPISPKFVVFIFPNNSEKFRFFPNFSENLAEIFGKIVKNSEKWPIFGKNDQISPKFVGFSEKIRKNSHKFGKIKTTNVAKIGE